MVLTYKDSGVDIDAGNEFIDRIIPHVKETYTKDVLSGVGGFAAHVSLDLQGIKSPVLVSSTDGVGTKLKIAQQTGRFDTIGIDLVAMCVNDIACSGAKPLFFLDYFAVEKLKPEEHSDIVRGIAHGCKIARCALIGGETAELPGIYAKDDFDLAGFAVGIIDKGKIIDGKKIKAGNSIIGVFSSGIHSNGYSLVRKICEVGKLDLSAKFGTEGKTLGETLLTPTTIYSPIVEDLLKEFDIHGIAHITGGGIIENIPRIFPDGIAAKINMRSWERAAIFSYLQKVGNVSEDEMRRVFNLGIGLVLVAEASNATKICAKLKSLGENAVVIGEIVNRAPEDPEISME